MLKAISLRLQMLYNAFFRVILPLHHINNKIYDLNDLRSCLFSSQIYRDFDQCLTIRRCQPKTFCLISQTLISRWSHLHVNWIVFWRKSYLQNQLSRIDIIDVFVTKLICGHLKLLIFPSIRLYKRQRE